MKKVAYVGVDYHMNSLSIAVMLEGEKKIHEMIRLANDDKVILKYFKKLSRELEIRTCYEASCNGYAFQRKMKAWGYACDVIAPALIPRRAGNRRKNDFRDARDLVQNYAAGMLSIVHPPSEEEEAVRGLIRCRGEFKDCAKNVKYRINSLVLSQGMRWGRGKWTFEHRKWLSGLRLPHELLQKILEEHLGHLSYLEARVAYLDQAIEEIALWEVYAPSVKKLKAFKGIGTLGAMLLIAELTDFRRFSSPGALMAFLGLIPSENSSGDKQRGGHAPSVKKLKAFKGIGTLGAMLLIAELTDFRRFSSPGALMAFLGLIPSENSSGDKQRGGPITKAGNRRCRTQLVEAVQHYVRSPHVSLKMKCDLSQVDAATANTAVKCLKRLHSRFWALTMKGKIRPVAITAIARELVGFIWAVMQPQPVAEAA